MPYTKYFFDLEADALLDDVTKVHCLVLIEDDKVISFTPDKIQDGLKLMSKADELIGHNIIDYDLRVLLKIYNFKFEGKVTDTLVMSRTIYPHLFQLDAESQRINTNLYGSHSLKAWGYRLGELKGDFNQGAESFEKFSKEMLSYCIQDVKLTASLYHKLVAKEFSQEAIDMEHEIHRLLIAQQEQGFCFDEEQAQQLFSQLASRKQELEETLQKVFEPNIIVMKTKTKTTPFNPASRQQIAGRLRKRGWKPKDFTPTGEPKIDEKILEQIKIPEAKLLKEYLMLNKRLGQIATGNQAWLKLVKKGRLHGRVNAMGAVTSRCTHSNPNLAQVPRVGAEFGEECRRLFIVPDGYVLLGCDASGLELRCLSHFLHRYDDGKYSQVLLEGDIHTANQEAAGLETRDQAKTFIYGFLYGAGDEKIGQIIGRGTKEGRTIKKRFLDKTPALKKLKEAVNKSAKKGWITGLDGRQIPIRHSHAALNTLLQSAGALICKRWYINIEQGLRQNGYTKEDATIVAFIHDEVQLQVRKGLEQKVGEIIEQAMFHTRDHYNFNIQLDSEWKAGANWAETH